MAFTSSEIFKSDSVKVFYLLVPEDPFFVVRGEVVRALNKTIDLYRNWSDLQKNPIVDLLEKEVEWTTTELRNSLKSIEWNLKYLEDTISIVEKNPSKFKLDTNELNRRRKFVEEIQAEVKSVQKKFCYPKAFDKDKPHQPLIENFSAVEGESGAHSSTKYSKLENKKLNKI